MKRVWAGALGLVLGGSLVFGQARAEGVGGPVVTARAGTGAPDEIVAKQRATTKTFYGWQILALGGTGGVVASASVLLPEIPLGSFPSSIGFVAGMPVYALGGPIVHWHHGDFTKGLISLAGNAAFAVAGGLAGQSIKCNKEGESPNCGERGFFKGLGVAILIAPILDAAILGWEDVPVDSILRRPSRPGLALAPTWSVGPRGAVEIGVAGTF